MVADRHSEVELACDLIKRTRYVGEVGLDGSPAHRGSLDIQRKVLRRIFEACRAEGGRIVSIHSRMAASPVLDEIERAGDIGTPILHWFSGSPAELSRAIDLGCWFSVGPTMLASRKGANLVSLMSHDRVLTETDGPFGQVEGRPLEPWDVPLATASLATVWNIDQAATEARLLGNLKLLVSEYHASEYAQAPGHR